MQIDATDSRGAAARRVTLSAALVWSVSGLAQDRIYTDDFETRTINNLIGLEEGFEGTFRILATVCDHAAQGIEAVTFRYRIEDSGATFSEVAMVPVGGRSSVRSEAHGITDGTPGSGACEEYETSSPLAFEYGLELDGSGLIEWRFQTDKANGVTEFYPPEQAGRAAYWSNETTAQAVLESALKSDSNAFVSCFDCSVNLNGNVAGPYDSYGFFFGSGIAFAIEYNGENRRNNELDQMMKDFEALPDNIFYKVPFSSVDGIRNYLSTISHQNE